MKEEDAGGTTGVNPVWWIVAGCYALLTVIALSNYRRFPFGELNFFTFIWTFIAVTIGNTVLNARAYLALYRSGGNLPRTMLKDLFGYVPYLLMAVLYDNIMLYDSAIRVKVRDLDLFLMKMDGIIFGIQPTIFLERYLNPLLVEYSMFAYSLFLLPFLYLVYLFQKGERAVFDKVMLAQVIASAIAIVSFIYLPAQGPRYLFNPANSNPDSGIPRFSRSIEGFNIDAVKTATGRESVFQVQYDGWNKLERVKTDCMPSMHTALYLICLIAVVRFRRMMKWKAAALVFWSVSFVSLVFSCVYLRYHWVVDIFAGAAVASLSFVFAERIMNRWHAVREQAPDREEIAGELS